MRGETARASSAFPALNDSNVPPEAWFRTAFGEHYLDVYRHRDDAAAQIEARFVAGRLRLPPEARVLDLCCGQGRHAEALERAGARVLGLDLSAPLIRRARGRGLSVLRADMRRVPAADASFDGVVNLFTSFGYFSGDDENAGVLREIARVLKPGGPFVMDHIHAPALRASLVPRTRRERPGGVVLIETRRIDETRRRVEKTVEIQRPGRPPIRYTESVRFYERGELDAMLRDAGLRPRAWFGSLRGDDLDDSASRLVVVANRAALSKKVSGR